MQIAAPVDSTPIEGALEDARQHDRAGDLVGAETVCRQILKADPNHPQALYRLARSNQRAGLPGLAIAFASRALAQEPTVAFFHRALGDALLAAARAVEAETRLRRALELAPDEPRIYASLGEALVKQCRFAEAEDI